LREVGAYEAKTHLPRLLDEVEKGEIITITRHGVPVAVLSPARRPDRKQIQDALARLCEIRDRSKPGPESMKAFIEEGRH